MTEQSDGIGLSRRRLTLTAATILSGIGVGGVQARTTTQPQNQVRAAAQLAGTADARPEPGSEFFENKPRYLYLYHETDTGDVSYISDDSSWTYISRQQASETFTGDGSTTGREITFGWEPRWFEVHRDDPDDAEMHEGVGVGGNHSMRTVGGALTTNITRSTAVYATTDGVMIGDGDTHANVSGATYVVVALP